MIPAYRQSSRSSSTRLIQIALLSLVMLTYDGNMPAAGNIPAPQPDKPVQTEFDHFYRRYARLLRDCIVRGRITPESIVRTTVLRDSIRQEFLRVTAENFGQWDRDQQTAFRINCGNLLLLSVTGMDLQDSSAVILTSRSTSPVGLRAELIGECQHDPRLAIAIFEPVPFGPGWSSEPVRAVQMDSTLAERWRDYLNRPENLTMNPPQHRITVNRWLAQFTAALPSDWAATSRFANADPQIAPLLAFLWSVADDAMRTRLEQTDQWTLVRPADLTLPDSATELSRSDSNSSPQLQ